MNLKWGFWSSYRVFCRGNDKCGGNVWGWFVGFLEVFGYSLSKAWIFVV